MAVTHAGVLVALDWEAAVFSVGRAQDSSLLLETTGPGADAASAGAERALARGASVLVSWGTAGALGPADPGDIVVPRTVCDESLVHFDTDAELSDRLALAFDRIAPLHRGGIASAASPMTTVDAKRALAASTGAFAVDMESAAIARVAAGAGVPMVAVRVVIDRSEQSVPAAAVAAMDGPRTRPGRVLAGLLKSPTDVGGLISLGLAAYRARRTLAACAAKLPAALRRPGAA
ncbi:MAG: hypothetical protein WD397_00495 [Wenzhouxiangellaceae bacterium]